MNDIAKESREPLWLLTYWFSGDDPSERTHKNHAILGHRGRPGGEPIAAPMETENENEHWMPAREHFGPVIAQYERSIKGKWL